MTDLFGFENPENLPMAELWMGAHQKAPSILKTNGSAVKLSEYIDRDPPRILGAETAAAFDGNLPFLFKVLSAGEILSIQAHPDKHMAEEGFKRENAANIPLDAPQRNYRDANHKPELICALTEFWGLRGFRPMQEIVEGFTSIASSLLQNELDALAAEGDNRALRLFFKRIMTLSAAEQEKLIDAACESAQHGQDDRFVWMRRIAEWYPGDIGILAPLYLNLVRLLPGKAMFLPAGVLHAYLCGTGIEIMANSDNVLRGGCTKKHIDVPELLNILSFESGRPQILSGQEDGAGIYRYSASVREFRLSRIDLSEAKPSIHYKPQSCEILLCTKGRAECRAGACGDEPVVLRPGRSCFVSADSGQLSVYGDGELFRAEVPV
jgi:mannose-6-phosphate isomerase